MLQITQTTNLDLKGQFILINWIQYHILILMSAIWLIKYKSIQVWQKIYMSSGLHSQLSNKKCGVKNERHVSCSKERRVIFHRYEVYFFLHQSLICSSIVWNLKLMLAMHNYMVTFSFKLNTVMSFIFTFWPHLIQELKKNAIYIYKTRKTSKWKN